MFAITNATRRLSRRLSKELRDLTGFIKHPGKISHSADIIVERLQWGLYKELVSL